MIEQEYMMQEYDPEMREILEKMLANDDDITARAVVRLHSSIKAASSITRSEARSKLLAQYQERQAVSTGDGVVALENNPAQIPQQCSNKRNTVLPNLNKTHKS